MANIIQEARELESVPYDRLVQEVENPTFYAPYLVAAEIKKRQDNEAATQSQLQQQPLGTVVERLISIPMSGIGGIPQQLPTQPMPAAMAMAQQGPSMMQGPPMMQGGIPPQGNMPMQIPMAPMAEGGIVGYSGGGRIPGYQEGGQAQGFAEAPEVEVIDLSEDEDGGILQGIPVLGRLPEDLQGIAGLGLADAAYRLATRNKAGDLRTALRALKAARSGRFGRAFALGRRASPVSARQGAYLSAGWPLISAADDALGALAGDDGDVGEDEYTNQPLNVSNIFGNYGGLGDLLSSDLLSGGDLGSGGSYDAQIRSLLDQRGTPTELQKAVFDKLDQREDLLTESRGRLTAIDQQRLEFEQGQDQLMRDLIESRRGRIEGRIDPEQDERDRLALLAARVGGAISRGRFQEGGIGGGLSEAGVEMLGLRERQRERAQGIEDSLDNLTASGLEQIRESRNRMDQIRREMASGDISEQEGIFEMQLERLRLQADIEGERLDNIAPLIQLEQLRAQENNARATLAAALAQNTQREYPGSVLEENLQELRNIVENEELSPQEMFENGWAEIQGRLPGDMLSQRAHVQVLVRLIQEKFPNLSLTGTSTDIQGRSEGGMVTSGFDSLIPQP